MDVTYTIDKMIKNSCLLVLNNEILYSMVKTTCFMFKNMNKFIPSIFISKVIFRTIKLMVFNPQQEEA